MNTAFVDLTHDQTNIVNSLVRFSKSDESYFALAYIEKEEKIIELDRYTNIQIRHSSLQEWTDIVVGRPVHTLCKRPREPWELDGTPIGLLSEEQLADSISCSRSLGAVQFNNNLLTKIPFGIAAIITAGVNMVTGLNNINFYINGYPYCLNNIVCLHLQTTGQLDWLTDEYNGQWRVIVPTGANVPLRSDT